MIFWLDVDSLSGSDGDTITTFPDSSGNGHNFTAPAAGNRPTFTNSTSFFNNKKSLWTDGSSDYMTNLTFLTVAQNYTYYFVFKFKEAFHGFNGGWALSSGPSGQFVIAPLYTSSFEFNIYDGNVREFCTIADAEPRVASLVMNSTGTALQLYTNGIAAGAATAWTQPPANDKLTIYAQPLGGSYLNGAVADMILYSGVHGTTDRQNIEDYLGTKFGITINH